MKKFIQLSFILAVILLESSLFFSCNPAQKGETINDTIKYYTPNLPISDVASDRNLEVATSYLTPDSAAFKATIPIQVYTNRDSNTIKISLPMVNADDSILVYTGIYNNTKYFDIKVINKTPQQNWKATAYLQLNLDVDDNIKNTTVRIFSQNSDSAVLYCSQNIEIEPSEDQDGIEITQPVENLAIKNIEVSEVFINHFGNDSTIFIELLKTINGQQYFEAYYLDYISSEINTVNYELDNSTLLIEIAPTPLKLKNIILKHLYFSIPEDIVASCGKIKIDHKTSPKHRKIIIVSTNKTKN